MEYEVPSRSALRHEKNRLRLVQRSGIASPWCSNAHCRETDIRYLQWSTRYNSILCANCLKKRRGLSEDARQRKRKRFEESGYSDPACAACGESDIRTLEMHHINAEANSDLCGPLCANCHTIHSDMQNDFPRDLRLRDPDRRALVLQAAFEFGVSILLSVIASREQTSGNGSLGLLLFAIVGVLITWALWNIAADEYLSRMYGPEYDQGVLARLPS